jgi:hypothetical protein
MKDSKTEERLTETDRFYLRGCPRDRRSINKHSIRHYGGDILDRNLDLCPPNVWELYYDSGPEFNAPPNAARFPVRICEFTARSWKDAERKAAKVLWADGRQTQEAAIAAIGGQS